MRLRIGQKLRWNHAQCLRRPAETTRGLQRGGRGIEHSLRADDREVAGLLERTAMRQQHRGHDDREHVARHSVVVGVEELPPPAIGVEGVGRLDESVSGLVRLDELHQRWVVLTEVDER